MLKIKQIECYVHEDKRVVSYFTYTLFNKITLTIEKNNFAKIVNDTLMFNKKLKDESKLRVFYGG